MKLTLISESSLQLGIGNTMHLSSFLNRLKFRIREAKHDLTVIDATWINPNTVREHQAKGAKVILFNNLDEKSNQLADIAVNGEHKGFDNKVLRQFHNVHFLGPKYIFLREEFFDFPHWETKRIHSVNCKIGIMLGGTDPLGLTKKIELELAEFQTEIISGHDIAAQMYCVDLMLTGCGIGFWESLAVGTPAIPFAANQEHADYYSPTFKLGQPGHLKEMIYNAEYTMPNLKYEVGQGADEVLEEILR